MKRLSLFLILLFSVTQMWAQVILQMDKATSTDKDLGYFAKCCQNSDLDSCLHLLAGCLCQKTIKKRSFFIRNQTNFMCLSI